MYLNILKQGQIDYRCSALAKRSFVSEWGLEWHPNYREAELLKICLKGDSVL